MHIVEPKPYTYHSLGLLSSITLVHPKTKAVVTIVDPVGAYFTQEGKRTIRARAFYNTFRDSEDWEIVFAVSRVDGSVLVNPFI